MVWKKQSDEQISREKTLRWMFLSICLCSTLPHSLICVVCVSNLLPSTRPTCYFPQHPPIETPWMWRIFMLIVCFSQTCLRWWSNSRLSSHQWEHSKEVSLTVTFTLTLYYQLNILCPVPTIQSLWSNHFLSAALRLEPPNHSVFIFFLSLFLWCEF